MQYRFKMLENEYWWGGTSVDGSVSPFDSNTNIERNYVADSPNQTMPMFLSNMGRCIWSEEPFAVTVKNGEFIIDGNEVTIEEFGNSLKDAYVGAMNKHFPPSGDKLPGEFFRKPQYNTWIHLTYNQTQNGVLDYAKQILEHGFEPGILIIDEGWQIEYGCWEFNRDKFPDPKAMIESLHNDGFIVMLWVSPHVRADGERFVKQRMEYFNPDNFRDMFLKNTDGDIAIGSWWNGYSALVDFTKKCDWDFLDNQLQALMENYGVDGFKFDGGTVSHYSTELINGPAELNYKPYERNIAWNDFGIRYKFHEYKDTFKGGGRRMIQRIRDRAHSWDSDGISTLVPNAILQGILGHPYVCPDMIGGGEWTIKDLDLPVDEELFVRMAQCSAMFPMMQFSWAPWEALSEKYYDCVKKAHDLHIEFSEIFGELADDAYKDGEPILRSLEYNYPHCGYEKINDQFMLGEDIMVAPVLCKGQTIKNVVLPKGEWKSLEGTVYSGGQTVEIPVGIDSIPVFIKNL